MDAGKLVSLRVNVGRVTEEEGETKRVVDEVYELNFRANEQIPSKQPHTMILTNTYLTTGLNRIIRA